MMQVIGTILSLGLEQVMTKLHAMMRIPVGLFAPTLMMMMRAQPEAGAIPAGTMGKRKKGECVRGDVLFKDGRWRGEVCVI